MKAAKMRVADFFCGAGGFSEGFRQMGFNVVFGLDNWQPAVNTHKLNHPESNTVKLDILSLKTPEDIDRVVPDVEIIIGSPPCVAFSGSNKAGKAEKGFGIQLIEYYLRIVAWKLNRPKSILRYWILENVPNSSPYVKDSYTFNDLNLPGGEKVALRIKERNILDAADYGAPQGRLRFFCGDYPKPIKENGESSKVFTRRVLECLSDPLEENNAKIITDPVYGFKIPRKNLTDHFYDTTVEEWEWQRAKRLKEDHGYMGRMSFPEDLDRPSRTIMATRSGSTREALIFGGSKGEDDVYTSYRMPTIREIASIMSFPITYQFEATNESAKYRLVGNAVCCLQARALAKAILVENGIKIPEDFIPLEGNRRPSFDLTGTRHEPKPLIARNPASKFARHIPYLKVRGFRVELNNLKSDFEKNDIIWSSIMHQGCGKHPLRCECMNEEFEHLMEDLKGFKNFKRGLNRNLRNGIPNSRELQDIYCNPDTHEGEPGPDEILQQIRDLIDEHYPEEDYQDTYIFNDLRAVRLPRREIPLRILVGQYAMNEYIKKINRI